MNEEIKYTITMTILRMVHARLSEKMGDEIPPYYNFYLEQPYDELEGRTTGFVNHEERCVVDMHDINSTVDFEVRVYLYPGTDSFIRSFRQDAVRFNNNDPSVTQYIIDLEVSNTLFKDTPAKMLSCPDILTGIPEVMVVLGTDPVTAFKTNEGELFPIDQGIAPPFGNGFIFDNAFPMV